MGVVAEEELQHDVDEVILDGENRVQIVVRTNGRLFHISFGPENLRDPDQSSPTKFELEYLDLVKAVDDLCEEDPEAFPEERLPREHSPQEPNLSEYDDPSACDGSHVHDDPMQSFALRPFLQQHIFQNFAPAASTPLLSTLRDRLFIPVLPFTIKLVKGELVPVQIPTNEDRLNWAPRFACVFTSFYWTGCTMVNPQDVFLIDKSRPQNPDLVAFQGKKCWFKGVHSDIHDEAYVREIDTLVRIEKLGLSGQIRVPKLEALVMSEEDGFIHGLLLTAISDQGTVLERRDDPIALRKRWYNEIERMLRVLHASDIVWGDFKPDNMLIDDDDNVWIIDFGGGRTEGWVDFENMHTKEGDLQGLARLKKFLNLK
jgi:hypothetical protein